MTSLNNDCGPPALRIEGPHPITVAEFKTFAFPLVGAAMDLPALPGAVARDAAGKPTLLHFAPGRFLAPKPSPETVRRLASLAAAGIGAAFDVEGKWLELALSGAGAAPVLAASIDVHAVLCDRECAAVQLFDCPAVLARRSDDFDLWVEASYAHDLHEMFGRIG